MLRGRLNCPLGQTLRENAPLMPISVKKMVNRIRMAFTSYKFFRLDHCVQFSWLNEDSKLTCMKHARVT